MAAPTPFMKGANALATLYLGSTKREIQPKSWSIQRIGEKIEDGVCGESRDRLDFETSHFAVNLELWQADQKMVEAYLEDQAVDDAGVQPLDKSFAMALKPRDGSKFAISLSEGCLDDWKLDVAGRKERFMNSCPLRFRNCKKVPL